MERHLGLDPLTPTEAQLVAAHWMAHQAGPRGALLADPPGGGKTLSGLLAARSVDESGPHLVVAPAHLRAQWAARVEAWLGAPAMDVTGTKAAQALPHPQERTGWYVVSYAALTQAKAKRRTWARSLLLTPWQTVTYDEAHRLTRKTKALRVSRTLQGRRLLLTGSPTPTGPHDLYPLSCLCGTTKGGYWDFVARWLLTQNTMFAKRILGVRARKKTEWETWLRGWCLRRDWDTLGISLPPLSRVVLRLRTSPSLRKAHAEVKRSYRAPDGRPLSGAGAVVRELRRLTLPPKLTVLEQLMSAEPGRVLVWCWYRGTRDAVAQALARTRPTACLRAEDGKWQRAEALQAWARSTNGALVATLATAAEGLDGLQHHCHRAFAIEENWLEATHEQADARLARPGQTKPVQSTTLRMMATIDATIGTARKHRERMTEADLLRALG